MVPEIDQTGLTPEDRERVAALAERVRSPLANRGIALAALTHKSWANEHRGSGAEDNERLEFLGDAVVDLLVSDWLMARFPAAREGELSKLRASVVDEPGLAAIGRALRLGELLRLGRGEELTGGREKASLLADATEAVVAAVFLDGGLAAAHRLIDPFLEEIHSRAAAGTLDRDFKTQLQELAQARFRASPRYRIVGSTGPDHAKVFEVEVEVPGGPSGRGSGRSKKEAEQGAARAAVESLAMTPPVEDGATPAPGGASPVAAPDPGPAMVPEAEPAREVAPAAPVRRRAAKAVRVTAKPAARAKEPAAKRKGKGTPTRKKAPARSGRKIAARRPRD